MTGRLGSPGITWWASHGLPPGLDALILPEDTYLLLHTVTQELDPNSTPLDLWAALERAARAEKRPLGSVVIEDGRPRGVTYIARVIVYDFDGEPICRKEAVLAGLRGALSELVKRGCETIGVFAVGTMRGGISQEEYCQALGEVMAGLATVSPPTLYLLGRDSAPEVDADA